MRCFRSRSIHLEIKAYTRMAAEASLKIVREILSACNTSEDAEIASKVPSMLRVLAQNLNHADRRVRHGSVSAFSAMAKNYKEQLSSASEYIKEFDMARASLAENQNEGDLEQLEILNSGLVSLGFAPKTSSSSDGDDDYMDTYMQPEYVSEKSSSKTRLHGMILRLASQTRAARPSEINAAVVQMRMVLVAGVISASLKIEANEAAEDSSDDATGTVARVFLSVKVAPSDDDFIDDLNAAIKDATDGKFKLGRVDFWETHAHKSGKDSPDETIEKSTDLAESEYMNDDGMYLDDDEKLASRVSGKKKGAGKRKPWSMFNPSSALGLNSVFNSNDLLEMIEYDCDEAVAAREMKEKIKVAEEPKAAIPRFGLLKRLFG